MEGLLLTNWESDRSKPELAPLINDEADKEDGQRAHPYKKSNHHDTHCTVETMALPEPCGAALKCRGSLSPGLARAIGQVVHAEPARDRSPASLWAGRLIGEVTGYGTYRAGCPGITFLGG